MPEDALELKKNLRCDMKARRNALTDEEKKEIIHGVPFAERAEGGST